MSLINGLSLMFFHFLDFVFKKSKFWFIKMIPEGGTGEEPQPLSQENKIIPMFRDLV